MVFGGGAYCCCGAPPEDGAELVSIRALRVMTSMDLSVMKLGVRVVIEDGGVASLTRVVARHSRGVVLL